MTGVQTCALPICRPESENLDSGVRDGCALSAALKRGQIQFGRLVRAQLDGAGMELVGGIGNSDLRFAEISRELTAHTLRCPLVRIRRRALGPASIHSLGVRLMTEKHPLSGTASTRFRTGSKASRGPRQTGRIT